MKIALASDHAGYAFKRRLTEELEKLGHQVADFGTDGTESCDYPDFGIPAARSVAQGENERAILVCTNGIGMGMLANRIPGARAAVVYSDTTAERTRQHHDSNVLCLGAGEFPEDKLLHWARTWIDTKFEGGRHERRVKKFEVLD